MFNSGKAYSQDLRNRVLGAILKGNPKREVADQFGVSLSFTFRIARRFNQIEHCMPLGHHGKRRCLTRQQQEVLARLIRSYPDLYLDEVSCLFEQETGVQLSIPTVRRYINRHNLTRQKILTIAYERDEYKRSQFRRAVSDIDAEMILNVDETSQDKRNPKRTHGYFPKGSRQNHLLGNFIRKKRLSFLGGLSTEGMVAYCLVEGSFTTALFNDLFRLFFLPKVGIFANREPCSVVILDNARIHHSDDLLEMIRDKGGIVMFLPPYSPDLAPIECAFGSMKNWLRRNRDAMSANPKIALYDAAEHVSDHDAKAYFAHCGYSLAGA